MQPENISSATVIRLTNRPVVKDWLMLPVLLYFLYTSVEFIILLASTAISVFSPKGFSLEAVVVYLFTLPAFVLSVHGIVFIYLAHIYVEKFFGRVTIEFFGDSVTVTQRRLFTRRDIWQLNEIESVQYLSKHRRLKVVHKGVPFGGERSASGRRRRFAGRIQRTGSANIVKRVTRLNQCGK